MIYLLENSYALLTAIAIAIPRILITFWIIPISHDTVFFGTVRTVVSFTLVIPIIPIVFSDLAPDTISITTAMLLVAKEMFIGLILGVLLALPFWIFTNIGYLVDVQRGAFNALFTTPFLQEQYSPLGIFLLHAAIAIFFSIGGLLIFLEVIYLSFTVWPILSPLPSFDMRLITFILEQTFSLILLTCLLYTSPSPRDLSTSRMPSSA